MSDLANGCEFLGVDGSCSVFSDGSRGQVSRRLKCVNSLKTACCYLCLFRSGCGVSCKYLERCEDSVGLHSGSDVGCVDVGGDLAGSGSINGGGVSGVFCSSCNVEMVWGRGRFSVDEWCGDVSFLGGGSGAGVGLLPVVVFVCSCCGRVEFRVGFVKKELGV